MRLGFSSVTPSAGAVCVVSVDAARGDVGSDGCGGEVSGETASSLTGGCGGGGGTAGSGSSAAVVGAEIGAFRGCTSVVSRGIITRGLAE